MASPLVITKTANPQGGMDPNPNFSKDKKSEDGLVEHLAGLELRDDRISVKGVNQLKIPAHQHDERKLFVGGLPTNVTEAEFLLFFEQFGEVIDSVVMIDRVTKRSRGFGFVTFAKEDVALSLLNSIPGKSGMINIQGKNCEIKASEPKSMSANAPRYIHGSGVQRTNPLPIQAYPPKPTPNLPNKAYGYPTPPSATAPNDRFYDSRNFDQLYNGRSTAYTPSSAYGAYQYAGWEGSYPYQYGHYARDNTSHQYSSTQGYYEASSGTTYSQYNYPATHAGYTYPNGYYSTPGYATGQTNSLQGAYRSDGSLDSYGEGYYEE